MSNEPLKGLDRRTIQPVFSSMIISLEEISRQRAVSRRLLGTFEDQDLSSAGEGQSMAPPSMASSPIPAPSAQDFAKAALEKGLNNRHIEMIRRGWIVMGVVEQERLRAARAKTGVECPDCGARGYYRPICPNCPAMVLDHASCEFVPAQQPTQLGRLQDPGPDRTVCATKAVVHATAEGAWMWSPDSTQSPAAAASMRLEKRSSAPPPHAAHHSRGEVTGQGGHADRRKKRDKGQAWVHYIPSLSSEASHASTESSLTNSEQLQSSTASIRGRKRQRPSRSLASGHSCDPPPSWSSTSPELKSPAGDEPSVTSFSTATPPPQAVANRSFNNLHQVLMRLADVIRVELEHVVPPTMTSILRPPYKKPGKTFYPKSLAKEYSDYFRSVEDCKPSAHVHMHKYMGNYRSVEDISHPWDRSLLSDSARVEKERGMYEPDEDAGSRSAHQPQSWRSVMSKHDKYAVSGRHALDAAKKIKEASRTQSVWLELQHKGMQQRRERCLHLLHVLQEELQADENRQLQWAELSGQEQVKKWTEMVKERSDSADKVMQVLQKYKMVSGAEVGDYLVYTLDLIRMAGVKEAKWTYFSRLPRRTSGRKSPSRKVPDESPSVSKASSSQESGSTEEDTTTQSGSRGSLVSSPQPGPVVDAGDRSVVSDISMPSITEVPSGGALGPVDAGGAAGRKKGRRKSSKARPSAKAGRAKSRASSGDEDVSCSLSGRSVESAKKCFHDAKQTVRHGEYRDATHVPAIIPLPAAYSVVRAGHGRLSKPDLGPVELPEKSYTARKILGHAKERHVDHITGAKVNDHVSALWCRMSVPGEQQLDRQYSNLLGHPLAHFQARKP